MIPENVYVYYRVSDADAVVLAARVRAMHASLVDVATCIQLLKRPEADAAGQTWMEIYQDIAPGFDARLAAAVAAHGLDGPTPRHIERFVPVA